jgi:hypothetical protein
MLLTTHNNVVHVEQLPFGALTAEGIVIKAQNGRIVREFELTPEHLRSLADYIEETNRHGNTNLISM